MSKKKLENKQPYIKLKVSEHSLTLMCTESDQKSLNAHVQLISGV